MHDDTSECTLIENKTDNVGSENNLTNSRVLFHPECQFCFEPCPEAERHVRPLGVLCECNVQDTTIIVHRACYEDWIQRTSNCPICRTPLLAPKKNSNVQTDLDQDVLVLSMPAIPPDIIIVSTEPQHRDVDLRGSNISLLTGSQPRLNFDDDSAPEDAHTAPSSVTILSNIVRGWLNCCSPQKR